MRRISALCLRASCSRTLSTLPSPCSARLELLASLRFYSNARVGLRFVLLAYAQYPPRRRAQHALNCSHLCVFKNFAYTLHLIRPQRWRIKRLSLPQNRVGGRVWICTISVKKTARQKWRGSSLKRRAVSTTTCCTTIY